VTVFDFITMLACVLLPLSIVRIIITIGDTRKPETAQLIRLAEAMGGNPVREAFKGPVVLLLVCVCWLAVVWLI
jgi:hypothetical protein